MNNQITLNEFISFTFLTINFIWAIFNLFSTRSFESKQKYVPLLIDNVYKPFYETIECNLFKKITNRNKRNILLNLNQLNLSLKNNNLLFYISDDLLVELDILTSSETLSLKEINEHYQIFSSIYLAELNLARKIVGLDKRTSKFKVHFKLYKNKPMLFLMTHYFNFIGIASTLYLLWFLFSLIKFLKQ